MQKKVGRLIFFILSSTCINLTLCFVEAKQTRVKLMNMSFRFTYKSRFDVFISFSFFIRISNTINSLGVQNYINYSKRNLMNQDPLHLHFVNTVMQYLGRVATFIQFILLFHLLN